MKLHSIYSLWCCEGLIDGFGNLNSSQHTVICLLTYYSFIAKQHLHIFLLLFIQGNKSKIIFSKKVCLSLCPFVRPSRHVPSLPKSHRNRKFYWTKLSDVFQGWQKYIQNHTDATAVLGKAKLTGILQPASRHTSKFHHGHRSWCQFR